MHVEIVTFTNTVYYTYSYVAIKDQFVTGFAKKGPSIHIRFTSFHDS